MKVDISNYSDVKDWIESIGDNIKKLTLINCAGINYTSFAHKADIDKWSDVINVNLIGTFNVIREVLPIMREEGYGRIINFSSVVVLDNIISELEKNDKSPSDFDDIFKPEVQTR